MVHFEGFSLIWNVWKTLSSPFTVIGYSYSGTSIAVTGFRVLVPEVEAALWERMSFWVPLASCILPLPAPVGKWAVWCMGRVSRHMKVSTDLWQRYGAASVTVPVCRWAKQLLKRGSCFQNSLSRRKKGIISFEQNLWGVGMIRAVVAGHL